MSSFSMVSGIILGARLTHLKEKGYLPSCVDVTVDIESALCEATFNDIGIAVTNLVILGPRTVFKSLFGMTPNWDSPKLKVYGEKPPEINNSEEFKPDFS